MKRPKFTNTEGGWKYRDDVSGKSFYIETVDQNHNKTFIGDIGGGLQSKNEIEANARLICAAPDLFDALYELIQVKDWKDKNGKDEHYLKAQPIAWENARKAIKKATQPCQP